jgi:hypothetical protein
MTDGQMSEGTKESVDVRRTHSPASKWTHWSLFFFDRRGEVKPGPWGNAHLTDVCKPSLGAETRRKAEVASPAHWWLM